MLSRTLSWTYCNWLILNESKNGVARNSGRSGVASNAKVEKVPSVKKLKKQTNNHIVNDTREGKQTCSWLKMIFFCIFYVNSWNCIEIHHMPYYTNITLIWHKMFFNLTKDDHFVKCRAPEAGQEQRKELRCRLKASSIGREATWSYSYRF